MIVQFPCGFQPQVGQSQEFRVTGEVQAVERDSSTGRWLVTVDVVDPLMEGENTGFSDMDKSRRMTVRGEMRGG